MGDGLPMSNDDRASLELRLRPCWRVMSGDLTCGRALKRSGLSQARIGRAGHCYRCICMIWSIGIRLWLRLAMIQSDPPITRSTIRTPNASASTVLVLSGPVVMCRKITAPRPGRSLASGQDGSHCHGPLLLPCEVANPVRNHLNFGITGTLMRGGGGAATLAALPTPLGSTVTLFIPPAFAGPGAIPLIGTFPAAGEPAPRADCANDAAGAAATTARIATAIFVEVLDMATLHLTCRDVECIRLT